jgi:hypothetical protein
MGPSKVLTIPLNGPTSFSIDMTVTAGIMTPDAVQQTVALLLVSSGVSESSWQNLTSFPGLRRPPSDHDNSGCLSAG